MYLGTASMNLTTTWLASWPSSQPGNHTPSVASHRWIDWQQYSLHGAHATDLGVVTAGTAV